MAKERQTKKERKKETVESLKRVHAEIESIDGKIHIFCPQCSEIPIIATVDYDMTNDGKYVWFMYLCKKCRVHVVHFSHIMGGFANVSNEYVVRGRLIATKLSKAIKSTPTSSKKSLPVKVGKRPRVFKMPDLD